MFHKAKNYASVVKLDPRECLTFCKLQLKSGDYKIYWALNDIEVCKSNKPGHVIINLHFQAGRDDVIQIGFWFAFLFL